MENRVYLQPAYVLFSRPFQNTSLMLDFFTIDYGRVRAIAKGARRQSSKYRPLLQPFHPLLIGYTGRGEVKTLGNVESSVAAITFRGKRLFSAIYLNEILCRLLHNYVEHKILYKNYQEALIALHGSGNLEVTLRIFELTLLSELGYAINFNEVNQTNDPIVNGERYKFTPNIGFELVSPRDSEENPQNIFEGEVLIAIQQLKMQEDKVVKSAKRLLRIALNALLGDKPLNSRNLFGSL